MRIAQRPRGQLDSQLTGWTSKQESIVKRRVIYVGYIIIVTLFFKSVYKSETSWTQSGIYLGLSTILSFHRLADCAVGT